MAHYINHLIEQGEHQQLDFKFEIIDSKKIARSLVAFANTDGGRLLVGVKDNGSIAGVRSEEEYFMVEAAAQMYSRPPVFFKSSEWKVEGRTVLEIIIPKSKLMPHYAPDKEERWRVYIRVGDQNLLANRLLLKVWERKKQKKGVVLKFTDSEKLLLQYLEKNSTITQSKYSRLSGVSRFRAGNILVSFILLDIIEMVITESGAYFKLKEEAHAQIL